MIGEREKQLEAALKEANEIIRSFSAVCDRKGERTNWGALTSQVRRILGAQHRLMYPEQYVNEPRA
jgi:hypothetical protein